MILYYATGACSLAPRIALNETGLPFTAEKVDLRTKQFSGGDFRAINPKGSVPVLKLLNGELLTEAAVILQYIADQMPSSHLMPEPGDWKRYKVKEWLNFTASDIHKTFSLLFGADRMVKNPEGNEQLKAAAREALAMKYNYISDKLGDAQYLTGDTFTAADCYLYVCLRWSSMFGVELDRWPKIRALTNRITARPAVTKALADEGLKPV